MKLFTLLASGMDAEPVEILAQHAIEAATVGGARAVGLAGTVGDVRPGMLADLALIDLADLAYLPFNSAARQLVFSETGRGVHTVLVDGQTVLHERPPHAGGRKQLSARNSPTSWKASSTTIVNWPRGNVQPFPTCSKRTRNLKKAKLGVSRLVGDSQE